jgi:hypothetical protein
MAVLHELLERAPHGLQLFDLLFKLDYVLLGYATDVCAGAAAIAPQPQQVLDLLHRESQIARTTDESQRVNVVL